MQIAIEEGVAIPPLGKMDSKRQQIVHLYRTLRDNESALIEIPGRTPRQIQSMARAIASQVKANIITRTEETGCRIWVRFKGDQRKR